MAERYFEYERKKILMKKRWLLIGSFLLMMLTLTGCGKKVADEEQIQADLEAYAKDEILSGNEKIMEITIDKRQTDKEQKIDTVWSFITTADDYISYQKQVVLTYGLYDKGWILDDVTVNASNEWIQTPLQGIDESEIVDSLRGQSITVDGEEWLFDNDNIKNVSVRNHDTDLDARSDSVALGLTVDDEVEEAAGELIVNYIFNNGWKLDSMSVNEEFTASVKPEFALNLSNEDLIAEIAGQEFVLKDPEEEGLVWQAEVDMHTVSINSDEISDFTVNKQEQKSKGIQQIYHCECRVDKGCAIFILEIEMSYQYRSGEWGLGAIDITSVKCDALDIIGEWTGTYTDVPYDGDAVLNITDADENGNIAATYSYTPSAKDKYKEPGSYYVSGTIDMLTLDINLAAGDWIVEPSRALQITKHDVRATLCVDEAEIKGVAHEGNAFEVTRSMQTEE